MLVHFPSLTNAVRAYTLQAQQLAGGLSELRQRAGTYLSIYRASGGNHVFPLIAAHGAMWAGSHFAFGRQLAAWLVWTRPFNRDLRAARLQQLAAFTDAFREINQQVCVHTWVNFHLTRKYASHPDLTNHLPDQLIEALARVHRAQQSGRTLSDREKREVFTAHFLNEQQTIVTPRIMKALAAFDWPLLKALALRPTVKFAYLQPNHWLRFRDFSNVEERITNGLRAFDAAAECSWEHVEETLERVVI